MSQRLKILEKNIISGNPAYKVILGGRVKVLIIFQKFMKIIHLPKKASDSLMLASELSYHF